LPHELPDPAGDPQHLLFALPHSHGLSEDSQRSFGGDSGLHQVGQNQDGHGRGSRAFLFPLTQLVQGLRPDAALEQREIERILPELYLPQPRAEIAGGSLREQEAEAIRLAMYKFNGDKSRVAESLGISTTTLWRRLRAMEQSLPADGDSISSGTQSR
jgi:predicted DNA-binding protein (UPF0251 family)